MGKAKKAKKEGGILRKIWWFIWEDNSIWSWIVNVILAFVLIKFVVYPGLGFVLGTTHPIVAVVSNSMDHEGSFDQWWNAQSGRYSDYNITKEDFLGYRFRNGFNRGDIMVLYGRRIDNIDAGDVIVFKGGVAYPIIHRVVKKWSINNSYYLQTKGDRNMASADYEKNLEASRTIGYDKYGKTSVAVLKIPFLGYIKIWFVEIINFLR